MSVAEIGMFFVLAVLAVALFGRSVFRLFAMMCLGRWENRFDRIGVRFRNMVTDAFGQRRVVREAFGVNHVFIFWGFLTLLAANGEFFIAGIFPGFSLRFLGPVLYPLLALAIDLFSLAVLAAVIAATIRRTLFRPAHIDPTVDAFVILSLIGALMIAYFGINACEMAHETPDYAAWRPISYALSGLTASLSPEFAFVLGRIFWWCHALALLFFLGYLPYSKHLHILSAIPNCFFRSLEFVKTVPRMTFAKGQRFGVSKVYQYSWKDLLDFYACTECGRCQAVCPAHATGKALNPKQVIHAGKLNLLGNGPEALVGRADTLASAPDDAPAPNPLIGQTDASVSTDSIWACTSCGACMQACPVYIEHVPKLIALRRHLVMERSEFPPELMNLFENTEQRSNPWGIAPGERAKWAQDREIRILSEDAKVDYLFYVGCSGAFDSRNRQTSLALAKLFNAAGLSWGILGTAEKCCGDSLRRLGNEYVFDQLARENVKSLKKHAFRAIVTACPHCYNTLKNDYKQFGADFEVLHYTELLSDLLRQGRLKVHGHAMDPMVYHDSCYLGRYNGLYQPPRDLLTLAAGGVPPTEITNHHERSVCCGAGAGRMWMDEDVGMAMYLRRTREALEKKPSTICVACPYCMTMLEDGLRDEGLMHAVKVRDVAEVLADAVK